MLNAELYISLSQPLPLPEGENSWGKPRNTTAVLSWLVPQLQMCFQLKTTPVASTLQILQSQRGRHQMDIQKDRESDSAKCLLNFEKCPFGFLKGDCQRIRTGLKFGIYLLWVNSWLHFTYYLYLSSWHNENDTCLTKPLWVQRKQCVPQAVDMLWGGGN